MGFIGRIMVVVFAALSLAVFTWSFGVYTQRIKFTAAEKDATPGIFKTQQARAAELSVTADRAFSRWSGNVGTVANLERERYPRRSFYGVQLSLARTGQSINPATGKLEPSATPVQVLVEAPSKYLDVSKPTGRAPILAREAGAPLDSIAGYDAKVAKLALDIQAAQMANVAAIAEREVLNNEIVGVQVPKVVKGLRKLISEQKEIETQANDEDVYSADFVTNREAEFGLLKKRRDAMTGRIGELDRDPERKVPPPPKKPIE